MTKHSYFPYTSTYSSTRLTTNKTHNIHHAPYTNIQHNSTLHGSNTIFNNGRYTTNIPTDPHTITTTDIKTNLRHIHTYIVSRHLATRGNNKILRTPPPYISSSEEILPRLIRRTLVQLITKTSSFLKSYLHKVDDKSHPSPLCPLCNDTHTSSLQLHQYTHHIGFVDRPRRSEALLARWMEKLAGGPPAGTSHTPTGKGHESG